MEEIVFKPEKSDFLKAQALMAKEVQAQASIKTKIMAITLVAWICLGISFAGMTNIVREYPSLKSDIIVCVGFLGAGILVMVIRFVYAQALLKNLSTKLFGEIISEHRISLKDNVLTIKTENSERRYTAGAFKFVNDDDKNLYIVTGSGNLEIVSKSALTNEQKSAIIALTNRSN